MKRHVFAQREKIPARPMISSGHSCSPHHHCKGIVLGLSCPARPPTLQPLASLTASPLSCLSATPRLCWLMGECEGMGPGMGLPLFSNETIARTVFISHFIFLSSFNGGVCSPTDEQTTCKETFIDLLKNLNTNLFLPVLVHTLRA